MILGVDAVGGAHLLCNLKLGRVGVDGVDGGGTLHLAAVDDSEPDGAKAKDGARCPLLNAGSVDGSSET